MVREDVVEDDSDTEINHNNIAESDYSEDDSYVSVNEYGQQI